MKIEMTSNNSRKPWIDALRGFAMLLVIIMHVPFAAGVGGENVYTTLIGWMFMPLFFFVSGLVMYNPKRKWQLKNWSTYVMQKFVQLIVPTSIVFLLLCGVYRYDVLEQLLHPMKAGCWFTITLFGFIVVYTLFEWLVQSDKIREAWKTMLLVVIALVLSFIVAKLRLWKGVFGEGVMVYYNAFQISKWSYFQYFVLGVLVNKYKDDLKRWIAIPWMSAMFFAVWTTIAILRIQDFDAIYAIPYLASLINILYVYSSIILITMIFYHYRSWFVMNKLGTLISKIGCNTLGIYLLHYLFLWGEYRFVVDFYATHPTPLIMFVVYVLIALLILIASMMLIKIIKVSPLLSQLILGKR